MPIRATAFGSTAAAVSFFAAAIRSSWIFRTRLSEIDCTERDAASASEIPLFASLTLAISAFTSSGVTLSFASISLRTNALMRTSGSFRWRASLYRGVLSIP